MVNEIGIAGKYCGPIQDATQLIEYYWFQSFELPRKKVHLKFERQKFKWLREEYHLTVLRLTQAINIKRI